MSTVRLALLGVQTCPSERREGVVAENTHDLLGLRAGLSSFWLRVEAWSGRCIVFLVDSFLGDDGLSSSSSLSNCCTWIGRLVGLERIDCDSSVVKGTVWLDFFLPTDVWLEQPFISGGSRSLESLDSVLDHFIK